MKDTLEGTLEDFYESRWPFEGNWIYRYTDAIAGGIIEGIREKFSNKSLKESMQESMGDFFFLDKDLNKSSRRTSERNL